MRSTLKKITATAMAAFSLAIAVPTAASAYGVTSANFYYTNASGSSITSIAKNSTVKAVGSVTYDATAFGWIPIPSTCYFNLETPYYSLNKPTALSGSWSSGTFSYVGYSDVSGGAVYRVSKSFSIASKQTKTATATTKSKSYTTGWYTGSVNTGTGHDSDGSSLCSFKTL